jgi:hypothetical protein
MYLHLYSKYSNLNIAFLPHIEAVDTGSEHEKGTVD